MSVLCASAQSVVTAHARSVSPAQPHARQHLSSSVIQQLSRPRPFSGVQLIDRSQLSSARRRVGHAPTRQLTVSLLDVTQDTWKAEVLEADKPVLVDFWATWCGPCKLVLPSVQQIAEEHGDVLKVVKVEADPNPDLMEKYKVYGLPTLLLFRNGEEVPNSHWEGAINKKKMLAWLEKHGVLPVTSSS